MRVATDGTRFSTIIVNYNGGGMLSDCVRSVVQEGLAAEQIIIVDNGSQDDSLDVLERNIPGTLIVRNSCNAGFACAVNQGIAAASADFVLLLNNDAELQHGALQAFAGAFDRIPDLAIAGGQLRYPDGRLQNAIAPCPTLTAELLPHTLLKWIFPQRFQGKIIAEGPIPVESVLGACVAVRRDALPKLGLLDEDYFFFFEEIEWCQRARRLGFEVYHLPAAQAIHLQGQTANRFRSESRLEYQRSKLIFYKKSRSPVVYFVVSALVTGRTFVNAAANTFLCLATMFRNRSCREKARVYWHGMAWHLLGRPAKWGLPGKCSRKK